MSRITCDLKQTHTHMNALLDHPLHASKTEPGCPKVWYHQNIIKLRHKLNHQRVKTFEKSLGAQKHCILFGGCSASIVRTIRWKYALLNFQKEAISQSSAFIPSNVTCRSHATQSDAFNFENQPQRILI